MAASRRTQRAEKTCLRPFFLSVPCDQRSGKGPFCRTRCCIWFRIFHKGATFFGSGCTYATRWPIDGAALLGSAFAEMVRTRHRMMLKKRKLPARRVLWHENGLQGPSGGQFSILTFCSPTNGPGRKTPAAVDFYGVGLSQCAKAATRAWWTRWRMRSPTWAVSVAEAVAACCATAPISSCNTQSSALRSRSRWG